MFSREALLNRVWGYDYYGGARTVDVHVRRVRAKLGSEHASRIKTVRSVGYRWEGVVTLGGPGADAAPPPSASRRRFPSAAAAPATRAFARSSRPSARARAAAAR